MTRVLEVELPKGSSFNQRKDGMYIDPTLKKQIDLMIKNVINDWDFTIVISGRGDVRVGKSLLGMQIAAYWANQMKEVHGKEVMFDLEKNFIFDGSELIARGNEIGVKYPYSPMIYDEAGDTLEGTKIMSGPTKQVLDFLRECGQYNFLNILILPDFFALPRSVAITRSMFLIDVTYNTTADGTFERGFFNFYSKRAKKKLYIYGKKELNYNATTFNFRGRFTKFYPIDEARYRQLKQDALVRRDNKSKDRTKLMRDAMFHYLYNGLGMTQTEIKDLLQEKYKMFIGNSTVGEALRRFPLGNEG